MGRYNFIKPAPRRSAKRPGAVTRRGFLKGSGAAAAAFAAAAAIPVEALATRRDQPLFQHGVASGDPLRDRVILWTRITPAVPRNVVVVRYRVARDPDMRHVVARGVVLTGAARDYTVKVDVDDLHAGTTYYYRFYCQDEASVLGRTRTLPRGATERLRLAVTSCSNHAAGYFNAYRRIAERPDLDAVLHLGDYLYEYGPDEYGSLRTPEPPAEMVTLDDYRKRHAQYKRDADSQAVHRQHPFICIWDDHEITNDSWRDGAQNHTEGLEGTWADRVHAGLQAYYEWMPVRQPDRTDPRRNQRAFRFGDLIDLVMLEERLSARSQQLPATLPIPNFGNGFVQAGPFADPTRTLLGAEQEAWLAQRLRQSDARWKFIGQGVMFAQIKLVAAPLAQGGGVFVNPDQWDGYQPARDRIYDIFKGTATLPAVSNCVVLTGDIHSSWAADLTQDPNNPAIATGGYNAATGEGSRAVEFVGTSVTSPGLNDPNNATAALLRTINPHFKYVDLNRRGYMLLDVTPARAVCEWWYVDTVASPSGVESFGTAFQVVHGTNRLSPATQTAPRDDAPVLAPDDD
jgi:alkaline phosphatase D